MRPTVPPLRHAIHPASAPACNPPCLCSGMQHHQQEHTTHTLVACLCPGMQLLRLCSGMRPTLPLRWHAAAPLAHRLPALLWHATPLPLLWHATHPASAPACGPSCLCSSMQSTPPWLWQATYPNLDSAPLPLGTLMTPQGRCNIGALFCMSSMTSPFQQPPGKSDPAYRNGKNRSGPRNHFLMPEPHSWA